MLSGKKIPRLVVSLIFLFNLILFSLGCSGKPDPVSNPPVSDSEKEMDSQNSKFKDYALCDFSEELVGSDVSTIGEIIFVDTNNPDGNFAKIDADGCRAGIFAPAEIWRQWDANLQDLFQLASMVKIWGKLVSFDGQLIIDLVGMEGITSQSESELAGAGQAIQLEKDNGDFAFEQIKDSAMLDVPLVYSGYQDLPGLCYLGAAGMLVKYNHPDVDFSDIVAFSGMGSSALHLNFPEMDSMLISPYSTSSIVSTAGILKSDYVLGFLEGGTGSDTFQPAGLLFDKYASSVITFNSPENALETLKQAISSGYPVEVHLNFYSVYDDFAENSRFWKDFLEKDHASHYMVVKGYDSEFVYLNDPTDPSEAAGSLKTTLKNFMDAWKNTSAIPNSPPIGPFWMLFLATPGSIPDVDQVISFNMEKAVGAPKEIRSFADDPSDTEFTLFLLLELGNAHGRFGEYLQRNGQEAAAEKYIQSGSLMKEMALNFEIDPGKLQLAAGLEDEAIVLLK